MFEQTKLGCQSLQLLWNSNLVCSYVWCRDQNNEQLWSKWAALKPAMGSGLLIFLQISKYWVKWTALKISYFILSFDAIICLSLMNIEFDIFSSDCGMDATVKIGTSI